MTADMVSVICGSPFTAAVFCMYDKKRTSGLGNPFGWLVLSYLFPFGPDLWAVARGGLTAIADNRRLHELGIFKDPVFLGLTVLCIPQERDLFGLAVPVDQLINAAQGPDYGIKFAAGHAEAGQINALEGNAPLFEVPLRFFGVKAFGCAKNLNVQGYSTSIRKSPWAGTV